MVGNSTVYCIKCGARGPKVKKMADAIAAWNTRTPTVNADLLAALKVMLKGEDLGEAECARQGFPRFIERREQARAAIAAAESSRP